MCTTSLIGKPRTGNALYAAEQIWVTERRHSAAALLYPLSYVGASGQKLHLARVNGQVGPLGLDGMCLTAAAFDGGRGLVAGDEMTREIETALCEHGRAFGKLPGSSHDLDVAFHVLVRPAARVGDIRKLREDESQFGEETEHLACHRLNVVLPANDDLAQAIFL